MNLLHIADAAFTDRHWQAYYALLELLHDRYRCRFARIGWERTKQQLLSLVQSDPYYHRFVVFEDHSGLGWGDFRLLAPGTASESVSVRIESAAAPPLSAFETLVAREFLRLLEPCQVHIANLMAETPHVSDMARRWNGHELNQLTRFQLDRATAQTERMTSWLTTIPQEHPELHLAFFSPIPEEYLEAHTELYVQWIRDMPTERPSATPFEFTIDDARRDIEWRRRNKIHVYTYALFDPDDTMIGHTNAVIAEADPGDAYQAMTGLNRDYRGRGLSRWLKAALFFKVGEDFPANKTMTTVMRAANAPIQKVNAEMGYTLVSSGHEYDLSADGLRRFLEHD